jgi:hypothetical protein
MIKKASEAMLALRSRIFKPYAIYPMRLLFNLQGVSQPRGGEDVAGVSRVWLDLRAQPADELAQHIPVRSLRPPDVVD